MSRVEPINYADVDSDAAPVRSAAIVRSSSLVIGLLVILALPLVIVVAHFRSVLWCPALDLAMTELRVRDVGTMHTPLIGLTGRIGSIMNMGSHPGPLSFYLLAPLYRLLGSSAWALQASCVALQIAWLAAALLIARRRGGPPVVAAVAAALALLMTGYGFNVLTEPWNPYLPVLPWVVFLLACWSVACGDTAMLTAVVFAGTFCAQTHVSYLALTVVGGALAFALALVHWRGRPMDERRRATRQIVVALALGVVLWTPPTIDQLIHEPGNYRTLIEHFSQPTEPTIGARTGAYLAAERLDLFHLVIDQFAVPGTLVEIWPGRRVNWIRGAVVAALWLVSLAIAVRLRDRPLLTLHGVVAVALVAGIVNLGRIFGFLWYYLMLWMWGIAALMAVAIGWTAMAALARLLEPPQRRRAGTCATVALVLLTTAFAVRLSVAATTARHWGHLGDIVPALVAGTGRALDAGVGGARGRDGRYLVHWSDTFHMGSQAWSLVNELERSGYRVGVPWPYRSMATLHRMLDPTEATASVVFANGRFLERYRADPSLVEVASADPRSPEARREYDTLRSAVITELQAANLPLVVWELDANLFKASLEPGIPPATQQRIARMLELGTATAVFIAPPDFQPPMVP